MNRRSALEITLPVKLLQEPLSKNPTKKKLKSKPGMFLGGRGLKTRLNFDFFLFQIFKILET